MGRTPIILEVPANANTMHCTPFSIVHGKVHGESSGPGEVQYFQKEEKEEDGRREKGRERERERRENIKRETIK